MGEVCQRGREAGKNVERSSAREADAGGGLENFDLWMAGANLFLEPRAGGGVAVAEEDGAGRDLSHEMKQLLAVGVGGEIEFLDMATARQLAGIRAEEDGFAVARGSRIPPSPVRPRQNGSSPPSKDQNSPARPRRPPGLSGSE
jgi:hypothetical protein